MARTNIPLKYASVVTHEGGAAVREGNLKQLRRTLSTCLLFEDTFYEGGASIANRLVEQAKTVSPSELMDEVIRAKEQLFLRHAPLWLAVALTRYHRGAAVGDTITRVIRRADELAETLAMYWKQAGKDAPLTKQLKRGVANAFAKFDAYQFSKYDRPGEVKLRDALFLTHPKPEGTRDALYRQIAEGTLPPADTWEVGLSAATTPEEKCKVWRDLLWKNKLGALALVRNLRNMEQVGVPRSEILDALDNANLKGILPYQLLAAWREAPAFSQKLDELARKAAATTTRKLPGRTLLVVDVSGSMEWALSSKGTLARYEAAGALAAYLIGVCSDTRIFVFSDKVKEIPVIPGFGIIEAISRTIGGGTHLGAASRQLSSIAKGYDRVIVITDEQAQDGNVVNMGAKRHYMLNVASYEYGVACEKGWTRISGFSPAVIDWIIEEEKAPLFDE